MEQFLVVATVHFLALLSPGPDFFLVARTAIVAGWRTASGACAGIAAGNAVFIALAFAGLAVLRPDSAGFIAVQLAGCAFLLYLGVLFLRHAGSTVLPGSDGQTGTARGRERWQGWWGAAGLGLLSALLNPKNALFYATLAAMLHGPGTSGGQRLFYAGWMVAVVLLWDLLVAALIGQPRLLHRFARALTWLERLTGGVLILLALSILVSIGWNVVG